MIEATGLSKVYGTRTAVDDLSFRVRPGLITGFLGPNGAGKSTTMRLVLGLDRPTSGTATVNGRRYHELDHPLREVGALLDVRSAHPGRSARSHLRILAASNGIPFRRVDEVLGRTGLEDVADKRVKTFSLGMSQRFGLATALLGDPHTLLLDEPLNGLDVTGIHWVRNLLRTLADEGRTVLVSSHLMVEVEGTADRLVVIGRGRLIADTETRRFIDGAQENRVRVETPHADALTTVLEMAGGNVERRSPDVLVVTRLKRSEVGELAAQNALSLHGLGDESGSLEEAFMKITGASVEYDGKAY
ncbi:ABC-2 type transport system ATP-binding protein [Saccharothrix tamanrassetensis]|uniref:ABC-2 type transport system ATP-binding protein n=1 Tax=Saccharothrix tamanrassetensis TaxID=1051531 RepID=A0A841CFZ6_9PSEU|nr:ATP-binding cassette domain-containing protein [Saccharothrix tamanrassetensis]MBB5955284.1 ABC-2 type transport system ATP-binding protein [Saccharothrix tamanrassetensis]